MKRSARWLIARPRCGGKRLRIRSQLACELAPGDSLAVSGVCLTVILVEDSEICADISPETLRVTTLGSLSPGVVVNLERPLRADGRLGGHFVHGHVDAMGHIEQLRTDAELSLADGQFSTAPGALHRAEGVYCRGRD